MKQLLYVLCFAILGNLQLAYAQDTLNVNIIKYDATCSGEYKNGAIYLYVNGGTPPYNYQWSNGKSIPSLYNLAPATYGLTITDNNSKVYTNAITIGESAQKDLFSHYVSKNAGCNPNDAFGEIQLYPYSKSTTIQWDDPNHSTTQTLSNLKAGFYTVTVTNGLCTDIKTISVPQKLNIYLETTKTKCNGELGEITIKKIEGGNMPYTYNWSDGSTSDKLATNSANYYTVAVQDINGCNGSNGAILYEGNPTIKTRKIERSNCSESKGEIVLDSYHQTFLGDYSFLWNNGMTGHHISNLFPGTYTVTITDTSTKCAVINSYTIPSNIDIDIIPSIKCGTNKGTLDANVVGGAPPYTYRWSHTSENNKLVAIDNVSMLQAIYLTITDSKGCSATVIKNISSENKLSAYIGVHDTNTDCYDRKVSINNGVPPFTLQWSDGTTTNSTLIRSANFSNNDYYFYLTITDSNGCNQVFQGYLNPYDGYRYSYLNTCKNTAFITPSSCNTNFTYKWSNGSTDSIASGLNVGLHTVTITDIKQNTTHIDTFSILSNENCLTLSNDYRIEGYVFDDINKNCTKDTSENGLYNRIIEVLPGPYYGTTNQNGYYSIPVPSGIYSVKYIPNNLYETPCFNNITINVDSIERLDFLIKNLGCVYLNLNIGTPFLRRCFDNTYNIQYCNTGSKTANNSYVELTLDRFLTLKNASVPYTTLGNNSYKVMLGNLLPNQCGSFTLTAYLDCDSTVTGQTHCIEGHIYPDTLCDNYQTNWSGIKINTHAECNGNEVILSIENEGSQNMLFDQKYIIIEDQVIYRQGNFKLNSKEKIDIKIPANGKLYRIEAQQDTTYPLLPSRPTSWIEACGTNAQGEFSTGFAPLFGNNGQAPYVAIDCKQSIGSYDPNAKQVYPLGAGNLHYISQNEDADYIIHFQNEGTDTALTVVLKDTLSQYLDPTTLKMGASSHPYQWNLSGNGILTITFDKINLLTKAQSDSLSQGYVKFNINQRENVPIGSLINNKAGIYFDYNSVIMTNNVFHTVNTNFLKLSVQQLSKNATVSVFPNPSNDKCTIEISGVEPNESLNLHIFNTSGQQVINKQYIGHQIIFHKNELPAGVYIFKIFGNNHTPIAQGKIIFL